MRHGKICITSTLSRDDETISVESVHMWLSNNESNDLFVIRTQSEEQKLIKATMLWRHGDM